MHIVCPHCTTSYAIDLAALGTAGRSVRCSRCKETCLARPEDVITAASPMVATAGQQAGDADDEAAQWQAFGREEAARSHEASTHDEGSTHEQGSTHEEGLAAENGSFEQD